MNEPYKVSICIPIYGVEKYIERCAISLFEQTYGDIEYVFINDCTKDNSIKILNNVINRYPQRKSSVQVISHKTNRGLAAARNTALNICTGEFIMHVDSDDYIEKNTVQLVVNKQQLDNSDIVSFGTYWEYQNKTIVKNPPEFSTPQQMSIILIQRETNIGVCGRLYRKELYVKNKIRVKEGVNMAEDYQVSPLLAYYASKVSTIQIPLYHYNLTNENSYISSVSLDKINQLWESYYIIRSFFKDKGDDFMKALYKAEIHLAIRTMIDCSQNNSLKFFFVECRSKIALIPKEFHKALSIPYRIIIYIKSYRLLRYYTKGVRMLRYIS